MKTLATLATAAVAAFAALASDAETVKMNKGENWWGVANQFGRQMPFNAKSGISVDLRKSNYSNQCASFLVSDQGRVIWTDAQAGFEIANGEIRVKSASPVVVENGGATLAEAFRHASARHFPAKGRHPPELFFTSPQYNTWIELTYHQNQKDVLAYADDMLALGFPAGVLMIDDTWQAGYGDWRFEPSRFPDPKGMVDVLHEKGFKVMLWMCPYVGMDLPAYRRIAWGQNPDDVRGWPTRGGLLACRDRSVKDHGVPKPQACDWWNGVSAFLDFSHPNANAWFKETLDSLVSDFNVDGFKLDGADLAAYDLSKCSAEDPAATSGSLNNGYAAYALMYPYSELRNCFRFQEEPVVMRLHDKMHEWAALPRIIADMIGAGLMGYPFICPDMVGGGDWVAFIPGSPFEQELFVRSAQIHALCPMMQLSASPKRVLDERHLAAVKKAVSVRQAHVPYIMECVRNAAKTGEPILRNLEYNYPGMGYAEVRDEFLMGTDLLVAPQTAKGAAEREVIVPPGVWKSDEGEIVNGPAKITVRTPLDRLPYFEAVRRN